jgi:hypothetical protein
MSGSDVWFSNTIFDAGGTGLLFQSRNVVCSEVLRQRNYPLGVLKFGVD